MSSMDEARLIAMRYSPDAVMVRGRLTINNYSAPETQLSSGPPMPPVEPPDDSDGGGSSLPEQRKPSCQMMAFIYSMFGLGCWVFFRSIIRVILRGMRR